MVSIRSSSPGMRRTKPPVVDTEGVQVTDPNTPVYSGATVKLAFYQKPYILRDGVTYGTSLKLVVCSLCH